MEEFNNHQTMPELWSPLDHISLSILIIIEEEHIQEKKQTIVKNSEEGKNFINEFRNKLSSIDISYIFNSDVLEQIT